LQHLSYFKDIVVIHDKNTTLFDKVDDILDTLGLKNISSDEMNTEDSSPYLKKQVHHIELPWLDEKIIALKHLRSYSKEKCSNPSCIHIPSATKIDT
jgi:hypothetical protein